MEKRSGQNCKESSKAKSQKSAAEFAKENYHNGLKEAILKTGFELKKYFPFEGENINELPNDLSFS